MQSSSRAVPTRKQRRVENYSVVNTFLWVSINHEIFLTRTFQKQNIFLPKIFQARVQQCTCVFLNTENRGIFCCKRFSSAATTMKIKQAKYLLWRIIRYILFRQRVTVTKRNFSNTATNQWCIQEELPSNSVSTRGSIKTRPATSLQQ